MQLYASAVLGIRNTEETEMRLFGPQGTHIVVKKKKYVLTNNHHRGVQVLQRCRVGATGDQGEPGQRGLH